MTTKNIHATDCNINNNQGVTFILLVYQTSQCDMGLK